MIDRRGNFSNNVFTGQSNTGRLTGNVPLKMEDSSPKRDNTNIFLIVGLVVLVAIIVGAIFWLNSSKDVPKDTFPEEEIIPEITSGGCDKLGLTIEGRVSYSCFDVENKLVKLYISRSEENVILRRLDFVLYSLNNSFNYSSNYGLDPGSFFIYQIDFNETDLEKIEVTPVVQNNDGEEECSKKYINVIEPCSVEEEIIPEPEYYLDENLNVILYNESSNVSANETENKTIFENKSAELLNISASRPQKKILSFSFVISNESVVGVIDEVRHIITVTLPENYSKQSSLTPNIVISPDSSISPLSGVSRNFTSPKTYVVTASDDSTQQYTVYVNEYTAAGEEEVVPQSTDSNNPVVFLFLIENSTASSRDFVFNVSDESNISQCVLILNNLEVANISEVEKNVPKTMNVINLLVKNYSAFVKCNDVFNNIGVSRNVSFSVLTASSSVPINGVCGSASRSYSVSEVNFGLDSFCASGTVSLIPSFPLAGTSVSWNCVGLNNGISVSCNANKAAPSTTVVTEVGGLSAGVWSTDLAAARQMAALNKNFYIVNVGNLEGGCSACEKAENYVFSKPEFKAWARENGIAMIYASKTYKNLEPTKSIYNKYIIYSLSFPQIIIVGYEGNSVLAAFTFVPGKKINGIRSSLTPSSFIEIAESYTNK